MHHGDESVRKFLPTNREVIPFDATAGIAYGRIRLANCDTNKGDLDKLIAAHAASLNLAVVTNNEIDFARFPVW